MKKTYFVTGTDTEVGKTLISASLLYLVSRQGLSCLGLKPVAAGCEKTDQGWVNEDALLLQQYASLQLPYERINPFALKPPVAPHIAALQEGKVLSAATIASHCESVFRADFSLALVEGAGGWRVPLNETESFADVAKTLQLGVILVVGLRLGCINHALLTAEAIRSDGLQLVAWVANHVDPNMSVLQENFDTLSTRIAAPCLGLIPNLTSPRPELVSSFLDINHLM